MCQEDLVISVTSPKIGRDCQILTKDVATEYSDEALY